VSSRGKGLIEFTGEVVDWVRSCNVDRGLLTLHVRHTSASLMVQENADPQVLRDMEAFFRRLVPPGDPLFRHTAEGPDDMPAHIKSALTQSHLSVPVGDGKLMLGTWQGIYLWEHRHAPHRRGVTLTISGE